MSVKDNNVRVAPASQVKRHRAAPGASARDEYLGLLIEFGGHGYRCWICSLSYQQQVAQRDRCVAGGKLDFQAQDIDGDVNASPSVLALPVPLIWVEDRPRGYHLRILSDS